MYRCICVYVCIIAISHIYVRIYFTTAIFAQLLTLFFLKLILAFFFFICLVSIHLPLNSFETQQEKSHQPPKHKQKPPSSHNRFSLGQKPQVPYQFHFSFLETSLLELSIFTLHSSPADLQGYCSGISRNTSSPSLSWQFLLTSLGVNSRLPRSHYLLHSWSTRSFWWTPTLTQQLPKKYLGVRSFVSWHVQP